MIWSDGALPPDAIAFAAIAILIELSCQPVPHSRRFFVPTYDAHPHKHDSGAAARLSPNGTTSVLS